MSFVTVITYLRFCKLIIKITGTQFRQATGLFIMPAACFVQKTCSIPFLSYTTLASQCMYNVYVCHVVQCYSSFTWYWSRQSRLHWRSPPYIIHWRHQWKNTTCCLLLWLFRSLSEAVVHSVSLPTPNIWEDIWHVTASWSLSQRHSVLCHGFCTVYKWYSAHGTNRNL